MGFLKAKRVVNSKTLATDYFAKDLEKDFTAFYFYDKGNKTAGTRVRKGMQELKSMAQDIRVDLQEKKSS